MRGVLAATVSALTISCAAPTAKDYEERLLQGRTRLLSIAKAEHEADPTNEDLLLIYLGLSEKNAQVNDEGLRIPYTPLLALAVAKGGFFGFPGTPKPKPTADEANEILEALDETLPNSSIPFMYRLHWLKRISNGDRAFWGECRDLIRTALKRSRWERPVSQFTMRWLTWLERHEPDPYVRASIDLHLNDCHVAPLIDLGRMIEAMAYCPVPPDPVIEECAALMQELCDRIQVETPDLNSYLIAAVVAETLLPARFLILWKQERFEEAVAVADKLEVQMKRERHQTTFGQIEIEKYAVKTWLFGASLRRMLDPELEVAGKDDEETEQVVEEAKNRLRQAAEDQDLQLEAAQRLESGALDYLRVLRADTNDTRTILSRVLECTPADESSGNGLKWALREKDLFSGRPLPAERRAELLSMALAQESILDLLKWEGVDVVQALLKEALLNAESAPAAEIRALKEARHAEILDIAMILRHRGESIDDFDLPPAIDEAKEFGYPETMIGFCRYLSGRVKEDRRQAASLLPPVDEAYFNATFVMIGESLRDATGQDFGYDLDAWKKWLTR